MKSTDPFFWGFATAWVLLGAGTLLVVSELAEWGFFGKQLSLGGGLLTIWFGVMAIVFLSQARSKQPRSDDPEQRG